MTRIHFTKAQAEFLKRATGEDSYQEALDKFLEMMKQEGADLSKLQVYLQKLMEAEKG